MQQNDLYQSNALFNQRGRLSYAFWSESEEKDYNRDRLWKLRLREWEEYQLLGRNFVFRLLFGHFGNIGFCRAVFTDLRTGRYSMAGPISLTSGDDYHLDYNLTQPHHFYAIQKGLFLSLDFDGVFHRLRCHTSNFDVELMLPEQGNMLISANSYDKTRHFFYNARRVFPQLRGQILFMGREYSLRNAFACAESGRAVLPFSCSRLFCCGSKADGEHSISLLLGWGFGSAQGLENALFLDGKLIKLKRMDELSQGENAPLIHFSSEDGAVDLLFKPLRTEFFNKDFRLLYFRNQSSVGYANGTVKIGEGKEITIDRLPMICQRSQCRF